MSVKLLERIDGIVPIVPTPFTADDEVDTGALHRLVEFAAAAGARAACLPAYASEFYKLNEGERRCVVVEAVEAAGGGLPIIAQVNNASARDAAASAKFGQEAGASAVAIGVPRMFQLPEADLFRYFDRVLQAIDIPVLIQDYNPSGGTVSPAFVAALHRAHPHFRFLKLEEPIMAAKIEVLIQATGGEVGILEGWGGMYMLELIPAGIAGVMPGLGPVDLLARIWDLTKAGRKAEAYEVFQEVLPQIVFGLQHMELYHHAEKGLLRMRGVLDTVCVRNANIEPHPHDAEHMEFLNARILRALERRGMPLDPSATVTPGVRHA